MNAKELLKVWSEAGRYGRFDLFLKKIGLKKDKREEIFDSLLEKGVCKIISSKDSIKKCESPFGEFEFKSERLQLNLADIEEKAELLVDISKRDIKNPLDILTLFENLCLPFNEGKGFKEAVILKAFQMAEIQADYHKGIGIIVPAKEEREIVVSSHIDLIPLFNKGFQKGREPYSLNGKIVQGALDNTMTNAVALILALKEVSPNVEYVFTEGEEIGLLGMAKYIKQNFDEKVFYINLDVTNEAWGKEASVEYDRPSFEVCQQLKSKNWGFTTNRECDDFDIVARTKGNGFSYCLPTEGYIHSFKNQAKLKTLVPYYNGLKWLLTELDLSRVEPNIRGSISSAMKFDSFEEYKVELDKEPKPEYVYSDFYASDKYSLQEYIFEILISNGIDMESELIFDTLTEWSVTRKQFTISDLAENAEIQFDYAREIISLLKGYEVLYTIDQGGYQFIEEAYLENIL